MDQNKLKIAQNLADRIGSLQLFLERGAGIGFLISVQQGPSRSNVAIPGEGKLYKTIRTALQAELDNLRQQFEKL